MWVFHYGTLYIKAGCFSKGYSQFQTELGAAVKLYVLILELRHESCSNAFWS